MSPRGGTCQPASGARPHRLSMTAETSSQDLTRLRPMRTQQPSATLSAQSQLSRGKRTVVSCPGQTRRGRHCTPSAGWGPVNKAAASSPLVWSLSSRGAPARRSGILVVVVEVDAQQEVLQVRLVAAVHQLGHHCGQASAVSTLGSPLQTCLPVPTTAPPVGTAHL